MSAIADDMLTHPPRTADPYRDLAVIDARAPRLNQFLTGLLALSALLTGAWPLVAVAVRADGSVARRIH